MSIIHTLVESWNWYRLKRKSKRSAQLNFQQLSDFHALIISNKSIPSHGAPAIDNKSDIGPARSTQK
jgi:hypothetical protein